MARTGTRTTPLLALHMRGLPFATCAMVGNACQPVPRPQFLVPKGSRLGHRRAPSALSVPGNENATLEEIDTVGHLKRREYPRCDGAGQRSLSVPCCEPEYCR
mgnify:CR=1 FL=1|jgi:hypothetical protein